MGIYAKTFTKPSKTKQSFKKECDINYVLDRYSKTGSWSANPGDVVGRRPLLGDFSSFDHVDYQTSLNKVIEANNAFKSLPAGVRDRFANDPVRLLSFLEDDSNYAEAVKLGLVEPKPAPVPPVVKPDGTIVKEPV